MIRSSARVNACLVIAIAGCRPSATVEQTTPIANLQTHRTASLRVTSNAFASQGHAAYLETAVMTKLREKCGFSRVDRVGGEPADLMLDLSITRIGRGGGLMSNENQATIDALLVITDGESGDLIGASKIRGKSSGMIVNNNVPEQQAIDVMAQSLADVFVKSGCAGPRVAKAAPPPPPPVETGSAGSAVADGSGAADPGTGSGTVVTPPGDGAKNPEAEAINEQGKEKLRGGDVAGALAAFQQAAQISPDARYVYNVCLTYQAMEKIDTAISECKRARSMNPDARLAAKIDQRLGLLAGAK